VLLMPVPLTATLGAVLVALLITVTLPLKLPVDFGANTMFMVAVCPAASVAPLMPLVTLKLVPLMLTPEMVTLEVPVLVSRTPRVVLSPTVSLPKFRLDVDDKSDVVDPEPVPLNATVTKTVPLMFLSVRVPVDVPDAVGLNAIAK
jgi:hypothetical protein